MAAVLKPLAASSMRMASRRSISALARKVNFEMAASKCDVFLLSESLQVFWGEPERRHLRHHAKGSWQND